MEKRFTFRLPADLFDRINEVAKNNHRSANNEIIISIKKYLETMKGVKYDT